jgi:hypothetical protein
MVPRLIAQEVTRNLGTPEQVRRFYRLFQARAFAFIVDDPVPRVLVSKYLGLNLPEKADAFIGAFAEWMQAGRFVLGSKLLRCYRQSHTRHGQDMPTAHVGHLNGQRHQEKGPPSRWAQMMMGNELVVGARIAPYSLQSSM